jgi:hypothetical protein
MEPSGVNHFADGSILAIDFLQAVIELECGDLFVEVSLERGNDSVSWLRGRSSISCHNREFIDRFVCLSAALCPTKMLEYRGVGGGRWWLRARNEREATWVLEFAQIRVQERCRNIALLGPGAGFAFSGSGAEAGA